MSNKSINPLKVASITGVTASAAILVGWCLSSSTRPHFIVDWRDVWITGSLGAMIGAHWSVTGRPWFGSNY
jgi:putative Mn2+ efflux pump MntP